MKFKFKLQTVLDVKEKILKQKQQELADLITKKINCGKEIDQIEEDINTCSREIEGDDTFSPSDIQIKYDYYHNLLGLKKEKIDHLTHIEVEINDKRHELDLQNKEVKALENLKEKKLLEHRIRAEKQNQALLDEVALRDNRLIH